MAAALFRQGLFGSQPMEPGELRSASWAAAVHALVLGSWYFIRPVRDEIASEHQDVLAKLTTATFVAMLVAIPLYAAIVKRMTRRQIVTGVYWFFAATLVLFWAGLKYTPRQRAPWVEYGFYVTASVLNLFVVSVFWQFIVDVFTQPQGKRLFGLITAGASLGGIIGSAAAALVLAPPPRLHWMKMPRTSMLLVPSMVLVVATLILGRIRTTAPRDPRQAAPAEAQPISGGVWSALLAPFRSPYLFAICAYMFLYTLTGTFLFFQQSEIVKAGIADRTARAALFARRDTIVNTASLMGQLFVSGHAMLGLGVTVTLCVAPLVTIAGFLGLARWPVVGVVIGFDIVRRVANFVLARPAREVLFTIVPREDKYKAKAFIDTFIYRGGDTVSSWAYSGLERLGLKLSGVAVTAAVCSAGWMMVAWMLGRAHQRRAIEDASTDPPELPVAQPGPVPAGPR